MGDSEKNVTVIGPETRMQGDMVFDRAARIEGRFEGRITGQGQLHVAEGAECKAEIQAGQVTVDGFVQGNIVANERVQLNAKGKIHGDVASPKMIVADGAVFVGNCTVGEETVKGGRSTQTSTGAPAKEASTPIPARR